MSTNDPSTAPSPSPASLEPPANILIVDDEVKNLVVLETILDDSQYRLVRAESSSQALLALVADEFALIILDIRMPEMTGIELAQLIKSRAKTAHVPIIFLTAFYNEDQHVLEGYDVGAVDYLYKPVNAAILRSKVSVFVDLYRKTRAVELANRAFRQEVAERRIAEEQVREANESLERRIAERTEALLDADRRKDEFLATLAHELRNPLAPVRNAIQILRGCELPSPELRWARDILDRQTNLLVRLIDDLMDVSRITLGKIELRCELVDLSTVVHGAIESARSLIEKHGHHLDVVLPHNRILLKADVTRLSQVFLNLLNNAAKYTEPGGRIELVGQQEGSDVVVSVRDNGIGIGGDKLPSIFDLFSQVSDALHRAAGGLGIGLSLARRLVEMHGGRIDASSDGLGRGSLFVVRLPIALTAAPPRPNLDAVDGSLPMSQLRVLVVDDSHDSAASLAMLLKLMGNTVRLAFDGEEALRIANEMRPQVVLCDIGMPKMNGYQFAQSIREQPWSANMILIAITGWGQPNDVAVSKKAGFDYHRTKPVDPRELMKLLGDLDTVRPRAEA